MAAGVAVSAAVLAGAFLVGDSVRRSLRALTVERLGNTNQAIVSEGFFREQFSENWEGTVTAPLIAVEAGVTHEKSGRRAQKVKLYGVDDRFFRFHGRTQVRPPVARDALLSQALAAELGAEPDDALQIRVEKPSAIPTESLHGRKDSPAKTIRTAMRDVLHAAEMGDFSLEPSQAAVRAVFVPLRRLQRELEQPDRVNLLLAYGAAITWTRLRQQYALADVGIGVREIDTGASVESTRMVLNDATAQAALEAAKRTGTAAFPSITYLANTLRIGNREVPYSLVAALPAKAGGPFAALESDAAILNEWAARELNAKPGDKVTIEYLVWQTGGRLAPERAEFRVAGITPIAGLAAERNLAPRYPGISDSSSIVDWDPPFPMDLKRIHKADEDYWDRYRTTPKAFIALARGQQLWQSRFGKVTSVHLAPTNVDVFAKQLRELLHPRDGGLSVRNVLDENMTSSRGATDFGEYFLYFSFFLIVSALLLAGLFFRFGVEQRFREMGVLRATGFGLAQVRWILLQEGALVAVFGAAAGLAGGLLFAGAVLLGLRTLWVGAVGTDQLTLYFSPWPFVYGWMGGVVMAPIFVVGSLFGLRRATPRAMLSGSREVLLRGATRTARIAATALALAALALLAAGTAEAVPAEGAFFGGGGLLLAAGCFAVSAWLRAQHKPSRSLAELGRRHAAYRPGRSALCITLIAMASFLVVAVDAFRREGAGDAGDKQSGTGGFRLLAESTAPIVYDPNSPEAREALVLPEEANRVRFVPFRVRPGDDASCLNLYQPRDPRILAPPAAFLRENRFRFAEPSGAGQWQLLERQQTDGTIPAIADATSLTYALHKKVGDTMELPGGVTLRFVAALADSVLQGEVIISEQNFLRLFPAEQGFRFFLLEAATDAEARQVSGALEDALRDFGFDITPASERLATFHRVENTYLDTFRALGGLGLLLGTLGLAAILLRNVLERRRELALLRAVGYEPRDLRHLVVAENLLLLALGVGMGTVCAGVAVAPALASRGGQLPWGSIGLVLAVVMLSGYVVSLLAARSAASGDLLEALRSE